MYTYIYIYIYTYIHICFLCVHIQMYIANMIYYDVKIGLKMSGFPQMCCPNPASIR